MGQRPPARVEQLVTLPSGIAYPAAIAATDSVSTSLITRIFTRYGRVCHAHPDKSRLARWRNGPCPRAPAPDVTARCGHRNGTDRIRGRALFT